MKKKILFIVNSIDFFISHRLNLAEESFKQGFDVYIIADKSKYENLNYKYKLKNFIVYYIKFKKNKINLFFELISFFKIFYYLIIIKPKVLHLITIKPIIYAGLISKLFTKIKLVISFAGLGHIFIDNRKRTKFLKLIIIYLLKIIFKRNNLNIIFQNQDDKLLISSFTNLNSYKASIISGSGIDIKKILYKELPPLKIIHFIMVSRLLEEKGVLEYLKASNSYLQNYSDATFTLIGDFDTANPSSVDIEIINAWSSQSNRNYLAYNKDTISHISQSHVVVLPSYREGYPKILIDASAVGRAIITTNVPGCKECVIDNFNGYLIEVKNYFSLLNSFIKIIKNKKLITTMSKNSRKIAEQRYSIKEVTKKHLDLYSNI